MMCLPIQKIPLAMISKAKALMVCGDYKTQIQESNFAQTYHTPGVQSQKNILHTFYSSPQVWIILQKRGISSL